MLGEFEKQLNNFQAAIDNFRKALELTELTSEQLFLSKRLRDSEERRCESSPETNRRHLGKSRGCDGSKEDRLRDRTRRRRAIGSGLGPVLALRSS